MTSCLLLLVCIYCVSGYLNDLWRFDGTYWTWISGSNTTNQYGDYGIRGIPSPSNIPGGRRYTGSWIDSNNNLWLFGGDGYAVNGTTSK